MIFLFLVSVFAEWKAMKLREARPHLSCQTDIPKEAIIESAKNLFSTYCHLPLKIQDFGKGVDPFPKLEALKTRNLSMTEFHWEMLSIFTSLRDWHTKYELPSPHSCFNTRTGLEFDLLASSDPSNPTVYVSRLNDDEHIQKANGPFLSQVKIGDTLKLLDGITFTEFYKKHADVVGGANMYATQRESLSFLSSFDGRISKLPEKDSMEFTLERNGVEYNVTLDWIAFYEDSCFSDPLSGTAVQSKDIPNVYVPETNNSYSKIEWSIYKNMGVLKLGSFQKDMNYDLIAKILQNDFKNTSGLLIDVTGNRGGELNNVRKLTSMLTGNYSSFRSIVRKTRVNDQVIQGMSHWNFTQDMRFYNMETVKSYASGNDFSEPAIWDDLSFQLPQLYHKPIGILTDAKCFSSCDVFTSVMKDLKAAILFGRDGTTAGGGANYFQMDDLNDFAPSLFPFRDIPMTVAWRQILRKDGSVIEDVGVTSDYMVRPTLSDVMNGTRSDLDFIISKLGLI